jgi:tripartite ATP-independent transporter DctM subunit
MPATIATIGGMAYPEMKRLGYSDRLSTGAICAGSTLAVLIPPSLTFIIYGIATQESIGKLFASGFLTGFILMIIYIITVAIWCKIDPSVAPKSAKVPWNERWTAVRSGGIAEIIVVFGISMGGLFSGLFTPTEAGAVGVFAMLLVSVFTRKLSTGKLISSLRETIRLTCFIYFLIAGASIYGKFFSLTQIPVSLGRWLMEQGFSTFVIMFLITVMYWILGCVVDIQALVLLTIPIFYPIIIRLGFDGIWFGAYTVVVVGIGGLTPPVALLTYVMHGVTKQEVPLKQIFIGVVPFMIAGFVMLVLLVLFPGIATVLPSLM